MYPIETVKFITFIANGDEKNSPYMTIYREKKKWKLKAGGVVTKDISSSTLKKMVNISKFWTYSVGMSDEKKAYTAILMLINLMKEKKKSTISVKLIDKYNNEEGKNGFNKQFGI